MYHWNALLYSFKNTKEPASENQFLSQYVVGLPSKTNWYTKIGKHMTGSIGTHPSPVRQFWLFVWNIFNE